MIDLLARLVGGAVTPVVDRISRAGAVLAKKLALFVAAAVCFFVVIIALTIAFDLWIASLAGAIIGALAVAGLYLCVGALAAVLAIRTGRPAPVPTPEPTAQTERSATIDRFLAPLLQVLQNLGLRREQLAVLAGASVAKQLRPVPLVGLAIVAGFLLGRVWKGWSALLSADVVATILGFLKLNAARMQAAPEPAAEPSDQAI